jgi:hypothetical protein
MHLFVVYLGRAAGHIAAKTSAKTYMDTPLMPSGQFVLTSAGKDCIRTFGFMRCLRTTILDGNSLVDSSIARTHSATGAAFSSGLVHPGLTCMCHHCMLT